MEEVNFLNYLKYENKKIILIQGLMFFNSLSTYNPQKYPTENFLGVVFSGNISLTNNTVTPVGKNNLYT